MEEGRSTYLFLGSKSSSVCTQIMTRLGTALQKRRAKVSQFNAVGRKAHMNRKAYTAVGLIVGQLTNQYNYAATTSNTTNDYTTVTKMTEIPAVVIAATA